MFSVDLDSWVRGSSTFPPHTRILSSASIAWPNVSEDQERKNKLKIKKRYELVLYYYTSFCHLVLKRITNRITVCSTVPINTPTQIPCNSIQKQWIVFEKHHQTAALDLPGLSYCCIELQLEAKRRCEGQADEVVAADVDERDQGLPPGTDRNPCDHQRRSMNEGRETTACVRIFTEKCQCAMQINYSIILF